jgi:hypothetical protein
MGILDFTGYLTAAKTALDIFKGIRSELPAGSRTTTINQQIEKAEAALRTSEAELAKALGYTLCQCTFPPQIMLWRESEQAHVCSNPTCGRKLKLEIGEKCPVCGTGTLNVLRVTKHPIFGKVGVQEKHLQCNNAECGHSEQWMHDPLGLTKSKK